MGANVSKLRAAIAADPGEYFREPGATRFANTLETLIEHAPPPATVLDIGGDRSGWEEREPADRMPYSFGRFFRMAGYGYASVNELDLDARSEILPFPANTFDIVTAWETIEHLWTLEPGGLLGWRGILNFWIEAHRVVKPGGLFFVATRNRSCPFAWARLADGFSAGMYCAELGADGRPGHAREFTADELRALARITGTFPAPVTLSRSSLIPGAEARARAVRPAVERFLGRGLRPDELGDSIYFLGRKAGLNDCLK
ncbi:MAG: hypothetical protein CMO68_06100 [Verrucomicrobiales bacterium]|nr:hypothetical protein [Verrucomicrobiales bacterium]